MALFISRNISLTCALNFYSNILSTFLMKFKKPSLKNQRKIELAIILSIAIISILIWNTIIIYPIKLFVVLLHEITHGLASIFTGGEVIAIKINYYLGGSCLTSGGSEIIIASAGYLGSLICGAFLFLSAYNYKFSLWFSTSLSIILVLFTIILIQGTLGIIFTLLFAIILFISPRYFNKVINSYLFKSVGIISCLYIIIDIKEDLISLSYRETDAQLLSDLTGISAIIWGLAWFVISIIVVFYLLRLSFRKGFAI